MPPVPCPFCRQPARWALAPGFACQQALCACGALGVWFGALIDADDGADHLLQGLAVDELLPAPQPTGAGGPVTQAPYDTTTRSLEYTLEARGYQLALVENRASDLPGWSYWARTASGLLLATPALILRELDETDQVAVHGWHSDPEVVRYQSIEAGTLDDTLAYIRRVRMESIRTPRLLYELGVVRREDELLVGRVGLRVARPEHREAEIWFVLRRDAWGRGHGREAVAALLEFGFRQVGLHRVYGDCDPRNARSARLMEKVGMQREGHLRENWWLKGEWCDSWIYAILDREWAAGRSESQLER